MNKNIKRFVGYTYLIFFSFIGFIGMVMYVCPMKPLVTVLQTVSAWTPNFVFLLMFKSFYPQEKRLPFIRRQFTEKIKPTILFATFGLPFAVFIGTLCFAILIYQKPFYELIVTSPSLLFYLLPFHLLKGPLGEELGWAFLLSEIQKKYTVLKSGVIVGLIWGFWHFPLWFISGYGWPVLVIYIISFLVCIVCCSIIINVLYSKCKNLSIAIIVHVLNNYLLGLFILDLIQALVMFAICYGAVTCSLILITKKPELRGAE